MPIPMPASLVDLPPVGRAWVLLRASLVLATALVVVPTLRRAMRRLADHRLRPHQQMLLARAISWVGYGIAISSVLTLLGFDLSVLLSAAGVFTVAIGFAAQTAVSNLISGIFLLIEQPFSVGDQITSNGVTGEILSVDLLSVKLRTPDKVFVRLPNQMLLQSAVTNLTRFDTAGATLEFMVAADQELRGVCEILAGVGKQATEVFNSPAPVIVCTGYTDLGATFAVTFWAPRASLNAAKTQMVIEGLRALQAAGVALPVARRRLQQEGGTAAG